MIVSHLPGHIRDKHHTIVRYIEANGRLLAELVGILAAVGLIIGGVMVTGMAGSFSGELRLAGGNIYLLLLLGALTSFLLGIGMTVTAAYIFLAIILAPALIELGLDKVAVHLFILYWEWSRSSHRRQATGGVRRHACRLQSDENRSEQGAWARQYHLSLPFFFVPANLALVLERSGRSDHRRVRHRRARGQLGCLWIARASGADGIDEQRCSGLIARIMLIAAGLLLAYPEMVLEPRRSWDYGTCGLARKDCLQAKPFAGNARQ